MPFRALWRGVIFHSFVQKRSYNAKGIKERVFKKKENLKSKEKKKIKATRFVCAEEEVFCFICMNPISKQCTRRILGLIHCMPFDAHYARTN